VAVANVSAADELLKVLPEKTLGFVQIQRLTQADARLTAFSGQAHWPLPGLLALFKTQAGVKEGLDQQGTAALVMLGEDQFDEPPLVLYVPVTNYDKFLAPIKRGESKPGIARVVAWQSTFLARRAGSYAVFAEPRHEEVLEKGLAPGGLETRLASLTPFLRENDFSAVVTRHGVHLLARMVEQQARQMRELLGNFSGEATAAVGIVELYGRLFQGIDREASALAVGVRFEKQGTLRISGRASLVASEGTAALLAKLEPVKEPHWAAVPAGPFVVAGSLQLPAALRATALDGYAKVMHALRGPLGVSASQLDEMIKVTAGIFGTLRSQSVLLPPGEGAPVYRDLGAVSRVDSASEFLDEYEKQIKSCAELVRGPTNKAAVGLSVRRMEIQGKRALEVTMQMPPVGAAETQQMLEKMFGQGGKINVYLAAIDEQTVVMSYVSKPFVVAAIETLRHPEKGLAADPLVAKTRALLPSDALAVGYWSPSGTLKFVNRVLKVFPFPLGVPVPGPLPEFPATPPVGVAVRTAPAELQAEIVIPAELIQAVMPYAVKLTNVLQGDG
jgi:hypothetical protein